MGWGICFALDENNRVYCADGCRWSSRESDYADYPKWPSARQSVLDYFEGPAHRELDMIRDECPGTPAALKEACKEHMSSALGYYDRISDDKKREWHEKMIEELTRNLEESETCAKEAHEEYKVHAKAFKEYKAPTTPAKTRLQEIERLMEPLKLEYEKEKYAEAYDRHMKSARYYKKMLKLENLFTL
jgi:hypothetical protein